MPRPFHQIEIKAMRDQPLDRRRTVVRVSLKKLNAPTLTGSLEGPPVGRLIRGADLLLGFVQAQIDEGRLKVGDKPVRLHEKPQGEDPLEVIPAQGTKLGKVPHLGIEEIMPTTERPTTERSTTERPIVLRMTTKIKGVAYVGLVWTEKDDRHPWIEAWRRQANPLLWRIKTPTPPPTPPPTPRNPNDQKT